jgi:Family of unknown function (DUF5947)
VNVNGDGSRPPRPPLAAAVAARRRAQLVSGLRGIARLSSRDTPGSDRGASEGPGSPGVDAGEDAAAAGGGEVCDLCGITIPERHRHLLHLVERRIDCACESCWNVRSGDPDYRPAGNRTLWLPDLAIPDDLWASFQIPIGLAFFMDSTVTACVVALYPSPGGATESELHFESWNRMRELNPVLRGLEPDIEGLVVNRLADTPTYAIAPIDQCYALTGAIKLHWEGISGGPRVQEAVTRFFDELRSEGAVA